MSDKRDDGGPAFPTVGVSEYESNGGQMYPCPATERPGMTLRDWFAGQALAGMFAANPKASVQEIADVCYAGADAMIAKRNKHD